MYAKQLAVALLGAAVLSACAVAPAPDLGAPPPLTVTLNNADAALKAGQSMQAQRLLEDASRDYPSEKMPWLRLAQLHFEAGNYGEAIVNAQKALELDKDDTLAHSILAVSGLRVARKALGELTQKNKLAGDPGAEAQELARLLRTALGEERLVPQK
jgi:Tfp pilus assembly protein PilF